MAKSEISTNKLKLQKTLARFDNGVTVEEVLCTPDTKKTRKGDNALFNQIMLETVLRHKEPDEQKRKVAFEMLWGKLVENKLYDEVFNEEALSAIRKKGAIKLELHIDEILAHVRSNFPESPPCIDHILTQMPTNTEEGKYKKEFTELSKIGKGGFGTVWKAQHNVDDLVYAIKKITFKYMKDSDYNNVIREVKSFSTLNHLNVVRYNQSWFENEDQSMSLSDHSSGNSCSETENPSLQNSNTEVESSENGSTINSKFNSRKCSGDSDDSVIIFSDEISQGAYGSFSEQSFSHITSISSHSSEKSFSQSKDNSSFSLNSSNSQINLHDSKRSIIFNRKFNFTKSLLKMMLYIQMEYCDFVLKDWMTERASGNPLPFQLTVTEIFKDLLNGVAHIHSKSIIHRDLKPHNIFYSVKNNAMKIGDFGLATINGNRVEQDGESSTHHTSACGTKPYAAPEQLSKNKYDTKVDMYSLGVILFEMLLNVQTTIEFCKEFNNFLSGIVPEKLNTDWPEYVNLVKDLTSVDSSQRPKAVEVLSKSPFSVTSELDLKRKLEIENLKKSLEERNKSLEERNKSLEEKDKCIAKLKADMTDKDKRIQELEDLVNSLKMKKKQKGRQNVTRK